MRIQLLVALVFHQCWGWQPHHTGSAPRLPSLTSLGGGRWKRVSPRVASFFLSSTQRDGSKRPIPASSREEDIELTRRVIMSKQQQPPSLAKASTTANTMTTTTTTTPTTITTVNGSTLPADTHIEESLEKLQMALRKGPASIQAAKDLLDELAALRTTATTTSGNKTNGGSNSSSNDSIIVEAFLDELLKNGPDRGVKLPLWTRWRFFTRFSQRARWASLRRTLDWSTPPASVDDDDKNNNDTTVAQQHQQQSQQRRRRRRALVTILRALAGSESSSNIRTSSSIAQLEKRAHQEQKQASRSSAKQGIEDMTLRRPAGLETPQYTVLARRNSYEVRRYEPFSVCRVEMSSDRQFSESTDAPVVVDPQQRSSRAFGTLAGYLFGKNQQQQAMKMTTPVLTTRERDGEAANPNGATSKTMAFVLPSQYWTESNLSTAPQPLPTSGVRLEAIPPRDRAVVMFGGYATKERVIKEQKLLLDALDKDPEWRWVSTGTSGASNNDHDDEVEIAQYNDPFTPPWRRLNEISVAVKPRE